MAGFEPSKPSKTKLPEDSMVEKGKLGEFKGGKAPTNKKRGKDSNEKKGVSFRPKTPQLSGKEING